VVNSTLGSSHQLLNSWGEKIEYVGGEFSFDNENLTTTAKSPATCRW